MHYLQMVNQLRRNVFNLDFKREIVAALFILWFRELKNVEPCLSLLPLFESLWDGHLCKINGDLELVPAFLYSLYLTLYKKDTSIQDRHLNSAGPKGVCLIRSWLYSFSCLSGLCMTRESADCIITELLRILHH